MIAYEERFLYNNTGSIVQIVGVVDVNELNSRRHPLQLVNRLITIYKGRLFLSRRHSLHRQDSDYPNSFWSGS